MSAGVCLGCDRKDPLVAERDLIASGSSRLPRGWTLCTKIRGWWHAPNGDEVERIVGKSSHLIDAGPPVTVPERRGKARDAGPLEEEIRMDSRKVLKELGYFAFDFEQGYRPDKCPGCGEKIPGGTRVPRGIGDAYAIGHGTSFWIEFKRPGRKRTPEQVAFAAATAFAGGVPCYLIIDPAEILRLHNLFGELGRLPTEEEFTAALETTP